MSEQPTPLTADKMKRLVRDAARYRYFRKYGLYDVYLSCCGGTYAPDMVWDTGEDLDKAVDKARKGRR